MNSTIDPRSRGDTASPVAPRSFRLFGLGIVGEFVGSFHPRSLPPMLRANYGRELLSWAFLPVMLGVIEGGTVSIVVKKHFAGVEGIGESPLNFAVAAVTAAPAMANIFSFAWASLAHGRSKVPFIAALQLATAILVGVLGLVPQSATGLALFVTSVILARVCWSGVVTIRTSVWRANYPDADRARVAGKMATVQALVLAATGFTAGWALDASPRAFLVIFPASAVIGLFGTSIYRRVRLRGQRRLARAERSGRLEERPSLNPMSVVQVLRDDPSYRRYMGWMFVFGLGNLMLFAPLAISLEDRLGVSYAEGIVATSVIPLLAMPIAIPLWAKLLSTRHVIEFRALHGWSFVAASVLLFAASGAASYPLYCLATASLGIGFAGGVLAWNLGHQDFAPPHRDGQYMGVHVTLTGLRGIAAPFLAVGLYQWFTRMGFGPAFFLVCTVANVVGISGFIRMARDRRRLASSEAAGSNTDA